MTKGPVFCTICLTVRKRNEAWFLLVENGWTDRLKILSWHDELAFHRQLTQFVARHMCNCLESTG
jgi:hypothetical protein